ncbi:hypothetical protein CR513_12577, partial [Mucuna pruriens]
MKHPTEDHSLFGIELIDELVEECLQLDSNSENISNLAEDTESIGCLRSLIKEADYDEVWEVHNLSDSEDDNIDLADLRHKAEWIKLLDQVCKYENLECVNKAEVQIVETKKLFPAQAKRSQPQQPKTEIMSAQLVPSSTHVGQPDSKESNDNSSSPPSPMELKPLPSHWKYAYLDAKQQFLVIIASNLHLEQEDKLLSVLRQHKKAIGWKLSDLPRINPSIYMHRILMEEEAKPIRQQ